MTDEPRTVGMRDIAHAVATDLGISNRDARYAIRAVLSAIASSNASGSTVSFSNFGSWRRVWAPERLARNPATGENVKIPGRWVVRFRPFTRLRTAVQTEDPRMSDITKKPKTVR